MHRGGDRRQAGTGRRQPTLGGVHPRRTQGHRPGRAGLGKRMTEYGAGEILLTSMDRDGTKRRFRSRADARGVRRRQHPRDRLRAASATSITWRTASPQGHADAVLAASIFHFGEYTVSQAKERMAGAWIEVGCNIICRKDAKYA